MESERGMVSVPDTLPNTDSIKQYITAMGLHFITILPGPTPGLKAKIETLYGQRVLE